MLKKHQNLLLVIVLFFLFAAYFYNLMFGDKSLTQLLKLQDNLKVMQERVSKLKHENVILQKEYFELKELEGDE